MAATRPFTSLAINPLSKANLIALLQGLPKTVQTDAIRRTMRGAANIVRAAIRTTAPVRSGDLRRSFKTRSLKRSRDINRVGASVRSYPSTGKRYYATMVEYGWNPRGGTTKRWKAEATNVGLAAAYKKSLASRKVPGQFFLYAAIRQSGRPATDYMINMAKSHISAAIEKYARRKYAAAARTRRAA